MTRPDIPDDIWLEIGSHLSPQTLKSFSLVSSRLRALLARPLLRHVFWSTATQCSLDIEQWQTTKRELTMLPHTVTISVKYRPDEATLPNCVDFASIHQQLTLFTSLHTLNLKATHFGTSLFLVLAQLLTLRTVIIDDCVYNPTSNRLVPGTDALDLRTLPLEHVRLHNITLPSIHSGFIHPIQLITADTLKSLDITWTDTISTAYSIFIRHESQGNVFMIQHGMAVAAPPEPPAPPPAPHLQLLEVRIPLLTRALIRNLAHLTSPRTIPAKEAVPIVRAPMLTLAVQHWSMEEHHLRELDRASQEGHAENLDELVRGLWSYTGPIETLGVFYRLGRADVRDMMATAARRAEEGKEGGEETDEDGEEYALRHIRFTPPAHDAQVLGRLLWALNTRINPATMRPVCRPKQLFTLEVCLPSWDIEILFAIRTMFYDIQSLIIQVGKETWDEGILHTLGGSILAHLPRLHTLRILYKPSSLPASHPMSNLYSGFVRTSRSRFLHMDELDLSQKKTDVSSAPPSYTPEERDEQALVVKDYLYGWNRYCKQLRRVQLCEGTEWVRRWECDEWQSFDKEVAMK